LLNFGENVLLVIAYSLLGASIKYIDAAFDEKLFSRKKALLLAPLVGILWAYLMYFSAASATILLSIVVAVLITGKVDNVAHLAGLATIVAVILISGYFEFIWSALIVITFTGVLDELGNDYVDKKNLLFRGGLQQKFIHYFFKYRSGMKLSVLLFAIIGFYSFIYFIAFLAFDVAYLLVDRYSNYLKHTQKAVQKTEA
jgi:hypothetical protein